MKFYMSMQFVFLLLVFWAGVFFAPFSFAQIAGLEDLRREELRQKLNEIQGEIGKYRVEIEEKQKEEKTLRREVKIVESQVKKTELEIVQTTLALRATALSIEANNRKIAEFEEKIERGRAIIAQVFRALFSEDSRDIIELIIASDAISDFFEHQRFLENLEAALQETLSNVQLAKFNIEEEQRALEEERESQDQLKALQEAQKATLKDKNAVKKKLLGFTKKEKQAFEALVKTKERDVEQIRSQIFLLEGVGIAMPLVKAYEIAVFSAEKTGVRPAFLLALLKQESSWGQNVGQCYLVNLETGAGKGKNTGKIYSRTMKISRDLEPFLLITRELGRDALTTLVSCPHPEYGYGGAMGPAQFLPSTWLAYRDRAAQLLAPTPDPWDIQDSFTVAALKLANAGAATHTFDAEWKAAMMYYAGRNWNNPLYSFYGDSVMEIARVIQEEIDAMK